MNAFAPLLSTYLAIVFAYWFYAIGSQPRRFHFLRIAVGSMVLTLAYAALLALFYFYRPAPASIKQVLFNGIAYERDIRTKPRPLAIHIVRIQLGTPGVSFLVTPPDGKSGVLRAATTSQFLMRHHVQLAVNGDFLLPWWSDGPDDFYPHEQDPVDAVGIGIGNGVVYGYGQTPRTMLVFGGDGKAAILSIPGPGLPLPTVKQAISGKTLLVDGGKRTAAASADSQSKVLHPRVAAALNKGGDILLLMVVDGRQPGYSEGVLLSELADLLIEHGADRAMNLDGGGSSTLVIENDDGEAEQLNCPIHTRIPRRERPVANHLGVFALPRILPP